MHASRLPGTVSRFRFVPWSGVCAVGDDVPLYAIDVLSTHDVENTKLPVHLSNDVHDAVLEQYVFAASSVMPDCCVPSSLRLVHSRAGIIL
jgi:hypothetical protein